MRIFSVVLIFSFLGFPSQAMDIFSGDESSSTLVVSVASGEINMELPAPCSLLTAEPVKAGFPDKSFVFVEELDVLALADGHTAARCTYTWVPEVTKLSEMATVPDRVVTVEIYHEAHSDYTSVNGYMANTKAAPGVETLEGIADEAVISPGFGIEISKGNQIATLRVNQVIMEPEEKDRFETQFANDIGISF